MFPISKFTNLSLDLHLDSKKGLFDTLESIQ